MHEVLSQADFVSLHAPLTPATRHLIGAPEIASMKPSAYLINCARGGLMDQVALQRALEEGRLAGAGLDVLEHEPPSPEVIRGLLAMPNVIVTPHVAWYSEESISDRRRIAAETVRNALLED
jgi:phosphoglycerate dehydrogenase-like enzyme